MGNDKESMEQIDMNTNAKTESTAELEMLYKGTLEPFEARFLWEAWTDYHDMSDSLSSFMDWNLSLIHI